MLEQSPDSNIYDRMTEEAKQASCRIEDIDVALSDYASSPVVVYLEEHIPIVITVGMAKRVERGKASGAELVRRDIDSKLAVSTD